MIENKKHYPAICFTKLPNSAINHSIRVSRFIHTFATMALQNGVDVKTVSSMLDHYSAALVGVSVCASTLKCGAQINFGSKKK